MAGQFMAGLGAGLQPGQLEQLATYLRAQQALQLFAAQAEGGEVNALTQQLLIQAAAASQLVPAPIDPSLLLLFQQQRIQALASKDATQLHAESLPYPTLTDGMGYTDENGTTYFSQPPEHAALSDQGLAWGEDGQLHNVKEYKFLQDQQAQQEQQQQLEQHPYDQQFEHYSGEQMFAPYAEQEYYPTGEEGYGQAKEEPAFGEGDFHPSQTLPLSLRPSLPTFNKDKCYLSFCSPGINTALDRFRVWKKWVEEALLGCTGEQRLPISLDCEGISLGLPGGSLELVQIGLPLARIEDLNQPWASAEAAHEVDFPTDVWLIDTSKGQESAPRDAINFLEFLLQHPMVVIVGWGMVGDMQALREYFPRAQITSTILDLQVFTITNKVPVLSRHTRLMGLFRFCELMNVSTLEGGFKEVIGHRVITKGDHKPWFPRPLRESEEGPEILRSAFQDVVYIHQALHLMMQVEGARCGNTWASGMENVVRWEKELRLTSEFDANHNPKAYQECLFAMRSVEYFKMNLEQYNEVIPNLERWGLISAWQDLTKAACLLSKCDPINLPPEAAEWTAADLEEKAQMTREQYVKRFPEEPEQARKPVRALDLAMQYDMHHTHNQPQQEGGWDDNHDFTSGQHA